MLQQHRLPEEQLGLIQSNAQQGQRMTKRQRVPRTLVLTSASHVQVYGVLQQHRLPEEQLGLMQSTAQQRQRITMRQCLSRELVLISALHVQV